MNVHFEMLGGGQDTILFAHGFPFNNTMWAGQKDLALEWRLILPDLRGMGRSEADLAGSVTKMEDFADDLAKVLDIVGIEKCVFCGLSMGGYIALEFWRRHADRLKGLILCDTNAQADAPENAQKRFETAQRVERENSAAFLADANMQSLLAEGTLKQKPEVVRKYVAMVRNNNPTGVAAAARGMAQRHDFSNELQNIDVPTLVLAGEKDALSPPEAMRALAERIPSAEFHVISGAGHLAPLENADETNNIIQNFMRNRIE
ncbi:MAG: alpha/beta fold hydrolase [Planctomycetia bacterium]|nr:alpha/beta fold hydrolase [Planctomycetia bacterium]